MFDNAPFTFCHLGFESRKKAKLLILLFALLLIITSPPTAHAFCDDDVCGEQSDLDLLLEVEEEIQDKPLEAVAKPGKPSGSGISISVDGEKVVGSGTKFDDRARTDKELETVDIQVKFDGLDVTRRLNIGTGEARVTYKPGETIRFLASWNYGQWIRRAELLLLRRGDKYATEARTEPVEVINVPMAGPSEGVVDWVAPMPELAYGADGYDLVYVLRVYDELGRYDETTPTSIRVSEADLAVEARFVERVPEAQPGEEETRIGVSNIPIYGGSVTVYGRHIPPGYKVSIMGESVSVDEFQTFVTSRILPPGDHVVDVSVSNLTKDDGLQFERDIYIPDNEWFYVGLADLTVGRFLNENSNILHQVHPMDDFDRTYTRGRAALYLKGKVRGDTLITAAFDTTEEDLDDIFNNLDKRDPRRLLRNLDPDDFYPVYGDDSTTVEDAPTSGRFYVRVERGKSHVMWGNFTTTLNGNELARFERGLYGGHAYLESDAVTSHGEPVASAEGFAAEPGTLPQRDEFRGTGGSAYFLRRQDITQGSEQVYIEVRDRLTGQVVERTQLRSDQDYEIDYIQGVILLRKPLYSRIGENSAVRQEAVGGDDQFLVATYEFVPNVSDLDGYAYGGRGEAWLNDYVRVGGTAFIEDTGLADQTLYSADVLIRMSEKSYFKFEWAESEGDSFGSVISTDGGFLFGSSGGIGAPSGRADAYRGVLNIDLGEATGGKVLGSVGGYLEERDEGFNAPGRFASTKERLAGAYGDLVISERTAVRVEYDRIERGFEGLQEEVTASIEHRLTEQYEVSVGVTHSDFDSDFKSNSGFGNRTDVGGRVTRIFENDDRLWVFGQVTVDRAQTRERNDRYGAGFRKQLNDRLALDGEVSYGSLGLGGLAALTYTPNETDKYYFGYRLDPDTTAGDLEGYDPFGRDYGSIVYGANRRINDQLDTYFEENYDFSGTQRSLTHTYGVKYTPDDAWTLGAGFEAGEVTDDISGDFDRVAVSTSASLRDDVRTASLRFEARFEDGQTLSVRDRNTYLLAGNYGYIHNDDWRFIAKIDAVISESDETVVLDGDYVEGSVGWAYRPAANDRLNALFRYTYLEDLPGPEQVNLQNQLLGPRQRSHVLEADFIYDLNERLSVGGKYGYRTGEIAVDRASDNFVESSAHLAIARADFHIVKKWDLLVEARALWLPELDQTEYGFLAGVYHHIGDNFKVGVGYNFADYSDDLTDLTYDDEGLFFNVVGKF